MKNKTNSINILSAVLILQIIFWAAPCYAQKNKVQIHVDPSHVNHTLRGGMGASWHAISKDITKILPVENQKYIYPAREDAPRGSAHGGNPPVSHTDAWQQIKDHASWLGMDFVRVEISMRMYEPGYRLFDWDNEEMQALYNILDWCEKNQADVFLQQMWSYVDWNNYPGVHPLFSAPRNLDEFAYGIATLLEYLTNERGYTCIKYFCMTNEPAGGGVWGDWWSFGNSNEKHNTTYDAWKRLKEEFDGRGITIPIAGPDWTHMAKFDRKHLSFAPYLGAFDIHSYQGVTPEGEANLKQWADWAHAQNKPFFLTEYGNMQYGYGGEHPGLKSFESALSNTEDVMRAFRSGTDGVNRWSFTNRGDLDGQFQLIATFDRQNKTYLTEILPENGTYYGFAMVSRFLSKYSSVVSCSTNLPDSALMSLAVLSPQGELSVFILNLSNETIETDLNITSLPKKQMNVYQVTKELVSQPVFELNPIQSFNSKKKQLTLPPKSITTVSSYYLENRDKGVTFK